MDRKKYGLQLRVPPSQQKKQPTRPPLPTPLGFNDDDDDDVEREISRQANKTKSMKDYEEQHKKALEEDPSVFDYDGVYDEMKQKVIRPHAQDREERKPKYIQNLIEKAKKRQREQEIIYEKKLVKERSKEDHLYSGKEKFVTSAYKKKLAEQEKWMEEERLRQLREEKEDVTKKTDLSDFYFNLEKNVAFGARASDSRRKEEQAEMEKEEKYIETRKPENHEAISFGGPSLTNSSSLSESVNVKPEQQSKPATDPTENLEVTDSSPVGDKAASITPSEETTSAEQPSYAQPKPDHHKRSQDAVAAAKERFLARKRAKEQ